MTTFIAARVGGYGFGVRAQSLRIMSRVYDWFGVQSSGFRVKGLGFRIQDSGFRVWGLGFIRD